MKLSFEARFCWWPTGSWTFPLNYLPLFSDTRLSAFCSHWLPSEPDGVRTFLHSCCILLLINNIASFVCLLTRGTVWQQSVKYRYMHYALIVWQTHSLLVQLYIWHQITNYKNASELRHLIPLCLALLLVETYYSVAFHGGFRMVSNNLYRIILVVHHTIVWLTPLLGLTCAVHREYADCIFIS